MIEIHVIVDLIDEVVTSMRNLSAKDAAKFGITAGLTSPYYFYGHPMDINRQMIERDRELTTKGKVYPAIALRLPTKEEMGSGLTHYNLNVAIFAETNLNWSAPERYANVIKPVLIPLYLLFIDRLRKRGFIWDGNTSSMPPHDRTDKPHHGVEETQGNKAYIFTNKLDAIELESLRINIQTLKPC
jgi:hypothetical protein